MQDIHIMLCHSGIDLHTQAYILCAVQNIHRALPRAGHLPERVVDFGSRRIQAERNAADACIPHLFESFGGWQGGGGRS